MIKNIVFTILLGLLVQASACSEKQAPKEASSPTSGTVSNYLSLMPVETNMLFYANFEELRQTPLGEDLRNEIEKKVMVDKDKEYLEFVKKTGVDLKRDVDEVWVGGFTNDDKEHFGGAIVRGKFDKKRIVDYLKKEHPSKVDEISYDGHKIYILKDEENQLTFLNSESVVVGNRNWLKAIIDQSEKGGDNVLTNPVMAEYINDVSRKNHLWGVFNLNELSHKWAEEIRRKGSGFKGTESIENMQSLIFYTYFDQKANVFIKGNFTTEEEAELLAEMMNGFKAMAKLMVSDDREAVDILNDIKITTKGQVVEISTKVDKKFFEKLKEKRDTLSDSPVKVL